MPRSTATTPGPVAAPMPRSTTRQKPAATFRARVRMYRQGLGDCFLITLPRRDSGKYFVLIDCGVLQGTPDAQTIMERVVTDILDTTGGKIDLLVATHEHWDHLSGFVQAADIFRKLTVDTAWLAWTEDPSDELAQKLRGEREATLTLLRLSANRALLAGNGDGDRVNGLLSFFGASSGPSTHDALEAARALAANVRYCKPQDDPVEVPALAGVRFYVLGPPRDEQLIKQTSPSARDPETYGLVLASFEATVGPALTEANVEPPFSTPYIIPQIAAQEMEFFRRRYWGGEPWRRIDSAWLDGASQLALQLDSATNNTSLVLAIELANGDVLLFAADAQVGNWLSWQNLSWSVGGTTTTGPDLLKRTIMYKVGHHGSHNATLKQKGLELMDNLQMAMIPVDEAMARRERWTHMPLPELIDALAQKTHGSVVRADGTVPPEVASTVVQNDLYYELEV